MAKKLNLDKAEQELADSYERGEWKSIPNLKKFIKEHQTIARNTVRKNKNVNIRITLSDLNGLRSKAIEEGMPYQTLIASVLHKFVAGTLVPAS